ncbi:MAG: SufS family cysteine desulfurase [Bacteroidales bacterium]|nr:SufS family cysteine desulfurase [Bacteroidales bacterium]
MTVKEVREQFPILDTTVYGKPLVYLDNAATAQRPESVVAVWNALVRGCNANIHRAVHKLAAQATDEFENTRNSVREFLNAENREEIIFTSGATASINLVTFSFGEAFVHEGDEVIVSEAEHHSNIVPWQLLCQRKGASLKVLETDENGAIIPEKLEILLSEKTKIVAISHISNVLGLINPVKELVSICHKHGIPVLVDGAQGIVHETVDVQDLDCDFYAFSGHKLYAATGTGVLYGKKKWLDKMPPFMGGGEMIHTVSFSGTTYAPLPAKFEAGTQNLNATPTLVPAIDFVKSVRVSKDVEAEQNAITEYLMDVFAQDARIKLYGVPRRTGEKIPLFSFSVEGAHHEDIALLLDKMGIAVRSGQMCAEPLMDRFKTTGMVRVSFAPYNTLEEAKTFVKCLYGAIDMLL